MGDAFYTEEVPLEPQKMHNSTINEDVRVLLRSAEIMGDVHIKKKKLVSEVKEISVVYYSYTYHE
jgi:hypothetical protein